MYGGGEEMCNKTIFFLLHEFLGAGQDMASCSQGEPFLLRMS